MVLLYMSHLSEMSETTRLANLFTDSTLFHCFHYFLLLWLTNFLQENSILVPIIHIQTCKSLQPMLYNLHLSWLTQSVSFPHELSRCMASHTLKGELLQWPDAFSDTEWVCRPESYFLLGEVSHCNKAGRSSQGTISTPGQSKGSSKLISYELSLEGVSFQHISATNHQSFVHLCHNRMYSIISLSFCDLWHFITSW